MQDVYQLKIPYNKGKYFLAAIPFGLLGLYISVPVIFGDHYYMPGIFERIIKKNPELIDFAIALNDTLISAVFLFSLVILEMSFRMLFGVRYKSIFFGIGKELITFPNLTSGKQFYLPRRDLLSLKTDNSGIIMKYKSDSGVSSAFIQKIMVPDIDFIHQSLSDVIKEESSKKSTPTNGDEFFSLIFSKENIEEGKYIHSVSLLSKILKKPADEINSLIENGVLVIKDGLSEAQAKVIQQKVADLGLKTQVCSNRSPQIAVVTPMNYRLFTISTISAILIIPGLIFAWLIFLNKNIKSKFEMFQLNPFVYILAVFSEMLSLHLYSNDTEILSVAFILLLIGSAYIGISVMISNAVNSVCVERKDHFSLSWAFFGGLFYINHKINTILDF